MTLFILDILITNLTYILTGKYFLNKLLKIDQQDAIKSAIFGIGVISFISLLLNFFVPLNYFLYIAYIILIISACSLSKLKFTRKDLNFLLLSSIFTLILIMYSNEYRPDAGFYHIPYIQILNENKIILGLANIHSRFGHVSIIQYLSGFNYSIFSGQFSTLIPLGSLISFLTIYFFYDLIKYIKNEEKLSLGKIFSLTVLIYIAYKINRYSEFGNDAPAHLILLYLVSIYLYTTNLNFKNFYIICFFSVFAFTNKVFLGLSFLIPLYLLIKNLNFLNKIIFSLPSFFLLIFILKNILVSGCAIYPVSSLCFKNLKWTDIEKTKIMEIEGEAWSKAWPQNKNNNIDMIEFNKNFNWLSAWKSVHLKYIQKTILPYLIFMILVFLYLYSYSSNIDLNYHKVNYFDNKLIVLSILSLFGIIFFFVKFPIYRYGYSYFIIFYFIFLIFGFNKISKKKFYKLTKIILIICMVTIVTKQFYRVIKHNYTRDFLPMHILIKNEGLKQKYLKKKFSDNFSIYYSTNLCFYSMAPCTNIKDYFDKVKYENKFTYNILYKSN